jgi:hydrogenase maturation protease
VAQACVIGIGNTLKGDDGVGVRVAELLAERDLGPDVEVVVGHLGGMQLAPHFIGAGRVIVVDAIDAGDTPGSIYRFKAEDGLPMLRSNTSHGISVPELITAARLCGSTAEVTIFAVQVASVHPMADELTPAVAAVVQEVAELVAEELSGA